MSNQSKHDSPVISVIIATKNSAACLPAALASLRSQQNASFECIVIDGGSTDGTVRIIEANADIISSWVSEEDDGIASAFNKGLKAATGVLVYFLGADDILYDSLVFVDVIKELPKLKRPYFFYGDLFYSYNKNKKLVRQNYSINKFRRYNCLPHQAMFLERCYFQKYGLFDPQYKYAMDYEHISRFIDTNRPQYINRVIAEMRRYGKSSDVLPVHEEMDRVRLARGYAGKKRLILDYLVLKMKMWAAKTAGVDW
ncbi:MAG: glycosyltransferase [Desulfobulbaceae bacterium]|nr:glycosyltransferase [Desulfobulbaceae bacterium]